MMNGVYCDNFCFSSKLTLRHVNKTNDTVYYINIYNEHNGYYPHSYLVEYEGYKNEGEL